MIIITITCDEEVCKDYKDVHPDLIKQDFIDNPKDWLSEATVEVFCDYEWNTRLLPVIEEIKKGRKIGAIKVYREITGARLRDAKEAVEKKMKEMGL